MIYFYCWKKLKKTCIFTPNWLGHLLLISSYLVPQQLTITKLVSKSARGMTEQLLKTSGAVFYPLGKQLRKTLWGRGVASPPPLYIQVLTCKNRTIVKNDLFCLRRWKFVNQLIIELKLWLNTKRNINKQNLKWN